MMATGDDRLTSFPRPRVDPRGQGKGRGATGPGALLSPPCIRLVVAFECML